MSWNEKDIEWLDEQLSSPMNNGRKKAFDKSLEQDPARKDAYETVELFRRASRLKEMERKLEVLREHDAAMPQAARRIPIRYTLAAAAAILILVSVAIWLWPGGTAETQQYYLAENFRTDYVMHDTDRSMEEKTQDFVEQQRAYNLYALERFDDAIPLLEKQWTEHSDSLALFYLIVSYRAVRKDSKARETYENNKMALSNRQVQLVEEIFRE